jgi:NAD(P)-dependent dehydrogenase (short-subunit alcohol dehydrogenase family)
LTARFRAIGHKVVKRENGLLIRGCRIRDPAAENGSCKDSMMTGAARTALVTGGAKRIGRAIVEDLAAHGFAVAIHCNRSGGEAGSLAEEIRGAGGRAVVVEADLTDATATAALIAEASKSLGPIGLLVNNASIFRDDSVRDFDPAVADRHFAIHVTAPAILARCFAEALPAGEEGLIVNIIDQRVWRLTPRYFSYTLSKSALWAATRTMAQALAPRIRVNAIGPGPTLASTVQGAHDFRAQIDGLILERGPELSEFGATIRYLWDARSVTGQMIALDGGQHLAWQTPDVTGMVE